MVLYILLALVMLGVIIAVHEFGHFIASRACGIPVKAYSIGFGPKLIRWKSKKYDTVFSICPIPLGGYCAYYGDESDDPKAQKEDDRAFYRFPVWKRIISVAAGPLMNLLLAFLIMLALVIGYGGLTTDMRIHSVVEGSAAQEAGIQANDIFVSINGTDVDGVLDMNVLTSCMDDAVTRFTENGTPITMTLKRDGENVTVEVTPRWDEAEGRYMMGISYGAGTRRLTVGEILPAAWKLCKSYAVAIWDFLIQLIATGQGLQETAGPIGTVTAVAQVTQQYGLSAFLELAGFLSINLGIVNLLPFPGLDGSRIVLLIVEGIRRKPLPRKAENIIYLVGLVILLGFMAYISYQDVARLINGG